MDRKIFVGIWIRVSTEDQARGESIFLIKSPRLATRHGTFLRQEKGRAGGKCFSCGRPLWKTENGKQKTVLPAFLRNFHIQAQLPGGVDGKEIHQVVCCLARRGLRPCRRAPLNFGNPALFTDLVGIIAVDFLPGIDFDLQGRVGLRHLWLRRSAGAFGRRGPLRRRTQGGRVGRPEGLRQLEEVHVGELPAAA